MNLLSKTVFGVLYASLYLASINASALTLGKLRGSALLGKELDVAVSVQYAADEDIAGTCFDADVRFGEIPVEGSRLTVKAVAGAQPQTQIVHISTSSRIEDAIVTINLKTSCGPKASRHYVLLADVVSDTLAAVPNVVAPLTGTLPSKIGNSSVADKSAVGSSAAPVAKAPQARAPNSGKTVVSQVKKLVSSASGAEHAAVVKATNQANTLVLEDLQRRVDGIEQWQAKSTAAEDLLKSQERNQVLESGINGLKAVTVKNQVSLQQATAALESIESENYGRSLVYALAALVVVCVVAVGYLFKRTSAIGADSAPWWLGRDGRTDGKVAVKPVLAERSASTAVTPSVPIQKEAAPYPEGVPSTASAIAAAQVPASPVVDVDFDIDFGASPGSDVGGSTAVVAPTTLQGTESAKANTDGGNNVQRPINTQEMLDVRQQAEFYMALGQHDDAVRLLESSIQNNAEMNPLVFLDLLKIFHTLSRREDFERIRAEFNQYFTGRIPPYADFLSEGNGLEAYEEICQQIVVLWPTEYTVDFIEQCLVRTPEDDPEQGIDLEAFKDLLLLHSILKRLNLPTDSSMVPFSTSRVSNSQLAVLPQVQANENPVDIPADGVPLPTLSGSVDEPAVDLDLDLGNDGAPEKDSVTGNLIDFDMSGFVKPESGKSDSK